MNKLISGAIAGATGLALLLGGAGTFALWNASTTVNANSVSSGVMTIVPLGTTSWMNKSADVVPASGVAIPSIAAYKIVPGDKVELTQKYTVAATGDNLAATLSYDPATIVAPGAADIALKTATNFTMAATGTGVTAGTLANTFKIVPNGTGTTEVTVVFTALLPTTVTGAIAQGGTLNLSALAFKLDQNTRP